MNCENTTPVIHENTTPVIHCENTTPVIHCAEAALTIERSGIQLRVVHPITLLKAKLENAVHLPQEKRQDVKHLKMMVLCVRAYLREKIGEVKAGVSGERGCLDLHELVLQIASSRTARTAAARYGIAWLDTMPMKELHESSSAKLRNFAEKHLSRWIESLGSRQ